MNPEVVIKFVQQQMLVAHKRIASLVTPFVDYPKIMPDRRFNCYPILFLDAFPNVRDNEIKQLSLAFRLGWEYVSVSDVIFDTSGGGTPSNVICSQLFYENFIRELYKVFTTESQFWEYHRQYLHEYAKAILTEIIKIRYGLKRYSFKEFKHCSANKISFGKMVIAGLAILNGTPNKIAPLAKSHDYFYIAAQLRDDLMDWYEDYTKKRYSFLIRHALSLHGIYQDDFIKKWPTTKEFRKMIYSSGAARWAIDWSEKYFVKARKEASVFKVPFWLNVIDEFLQSLNSLSSDIDAILKRDYSREMKGG